MRQMTAVMFYDFYIVFMTGFDDFCNGGIDFFPPGIKTPAEVGAAERHDDIDPGRGKLSGFIVKILLRPVIYLLLIVPEYPVSVLCFFHLFKFLTLPLICKLVPGEATMEFALLSIRRLRI